MVLIYIYLYHKTINHLLEQRKKIENFTKEIKATNRNLNVLVYLINNWNPIPVKLTIDFSSHPQLYPSSISINLLLSPQLLIQLER